MYQNGKVLWKEGMFLHPQHFQRSEAWMRHQSVGSLKAFCPHCYGFIDIAVDGDALSGGQFLLTHCSGILPDATFFSLPADGALPPARDISERFSHEQQSLDVYLGLPVRLEGKPSVRLNALPDTAGDGERYVEQSKEVIEELSGTGKKEIAFGYPLFQILFSGELLDNHSVLPVGRCIRNQSGAFTTDPAFIPPLLHIKASPPLMTSLRSVLEMLLAKCATLSQSRKTAAGGLAGFSGSEESAFRLLHTLNTFTPLLNHFHFAPDRHPYELFSLLTQFCGALCTFSSAVSLQDLPRFEHNSFSATFSAFERIIRTVLEADISARSVNIPISRINPATYLCTISNERLLAEARFFFGVSASISEKELIVGVLQRVKMSSREQLNLLISSAMPGIALKHCPNPPDALSTRPGMCYFSIDQKSSLWEAVRTSGTLAFYFPNDFPDLNMEIVAMKE